MRKNIIALVTLIILAGGYLLFKGNKSNTIPATSDQTQTATPVENAVSYTDSGFIPVTLNIKRGEAATFKNESAQTMWIASGAHPTHTLYPTTGGCIGSTFDACKGIKPGDIWLFEFDIAGSWKYHNHLNPVNTGIIIVE